MLTRHGEGRRVPARILPPGPARLRFIGKCNLPRLNPLDKAIDRSLMRPVTVALSPRQYTCPSPLRGLSLYGPATRTNAAKGCEGNETLTSVESEPHVRRVSESLSVSHEYNQQRRTRCIAWCEERARAARWRWSIATSQGRHRSNRKPRKTVR
jgi:hypothetical protein